MFYTIFSMVSPLSSPDTIILLIVDQKRKRKILIPLNLESIIVHFSDAV